MIYKLWDITGTGEFNIQLFGEEEYLREHLYALGYRHLTFKYLRFIRCET